MFDWKEFLKQMLATPLVKEFVKKLLTDALTRLFDAVPAGASASVSGFTPEQKDRAVDDALNAL